MSEPREVIATRWFGVFRLVGGKLRDQQVFPTEGEALAIRLRERREGRLAREEIEFVQRLTPAPRVTGDRRLGALGVTVARSSSGAGMDLPGPGRSFQRELLLREGAASLRRSWDPSVHLQESVRAIDELDHVLNLLGERLTSWAERDVRGDGADEPPTAHALAAALAEGTARSDSALAPSDPAIVEARAELARLFLETTRTRHAIEVSLAQAIPRKAPNLSALLGPLLAARLIALAGGLERLARLPASTVQVLGAERAFFEHLRGRGPPPRHGALFLHPAIQGRPRRDRGKLARALAGKVAIAARLDLEGAPLRPDVLAAFQARAEAIRSSPKSARARRAAATPST